MPSKAAAPKPAPSPAPVAEAPAKKTRGLNFQLQVGLISLPIKLYTGARAERISFRQLHKDCLAALKMQPMFCPSCDRAAVGEDGKSEIVKGFEFRKDEYLIVSDEELEAMKPDKTNTIEIEFFADEAEIDPIYLETSHYVTPGQNAARGYLLVCELLRKSHKVGIGKVTMNSREHVVMLRPHGRGLSLHTLFYESELNSIEVPVEQMTVPPAELRLGMQLVESMTQPFRPQEHVDSYAKNVRSMIAAKLAGQPVTAVAKKPVAPQQDLLSALTASVNAAKRGKKVA